MGELTEHTCITSLELLLPLWADLALQQAAICSKEARVTTSRLVSLTSRYVNGVHYSRTLEAWLQKQDAQRTAVMGIFDKTYGRDASLCWFMRWRMFYIACSELFRYRGGEEWGLGHYLFQKK